MKTLYPASYMANPNRFMQDGRSAEWTKEENKMFESALAIFEEDTPDRWIKVAALIPGKTVWDVMKQYRELEEDVSEIEAGRFPIPGYLTSSDTFDLVQDSRSFDSYRMKSSTAKIYDPEKKKGIPWTEEEHRRFLMGLLKYGKGDWRNISRNFVVTKTATQVASHAQKYFIRQVSGGKDKRRPSIHDITTNNLNEVSNEGNNNTNCRPSLLDLDPIFPSQKNPTGPTRVFLDWDQYADDDGGGVIGLNSGRGNIYLSSSSNGHRQGKKNIYGAYTIPHNSVF